MVRTGEDLIAQPGPCFSDMSLLSFIRQNLPGKPNAYRELGFEPQVCAPSPGLGVYSKCSVNRVLFAA